MDEDLGKSCFSADLLRDENEFASVVLYTSNASHLLQRLNPINGLLQRPTSPKAELKNVGRAENISRQQFTETHLSFQAKMGGQVFVRHDFALLDVLNKLCQHALRLAEEEAIMKVKLLIWQPRF